MLILKMSTGFVRKRIARFFRTILRTTVLSIIFFLFLSKSKQGHFGALENQLSLQYHSESQFEEGISDAETQCESSPGGLMRNYETPSSSSSFDISELVNRPLAYLPSRSGSPSGPNTDLCLAGKRPRSGSPSGPNTDLCLAGKRPRSGSPSGPNTGLSLGGNRPTSNGNPSTSNGNPPTHNGNPPTHNGNPPTRNGNPLTRYFDTILERVIASYFAIHDFENARRMRVRNRRVISLNRRLRYLNRILNLNPELLAFYGRCARGLMEDIEIDQIETREELEEYLYILHYDPTVLNTAMDEWLFWPFV